MFCVPIFTCVFTCVCFLSPTKQNPKHTPSREARHITVGRVHPLQRTRIGSALVCVRRNVQHRELKLSKSTRFALVTIVMVDVPTGCVVSPPPLFSQNIQSHEKSPTSHRAQGVPPTVGLALGANRIVCLCVCFLPIHSGHQVRWTYTSRGHTGGRSHRIFHPPSFCGACLSFSREKDSAIIPFPRRP